MHWLRRMFLSERKQQPSPPARPQDPPRLASDPQKVRAEQRASDLARRIAALDMILDTQSRNEEIRSA